MKDDTSLTPEAFEALLAWLGSDDRDRGGEIYKQIRRRLIKIFECRGCYDAEELTDTTINRVATKVPQIAKDYVGEKALYFYAVAQKVVLESWRKRAPVAPPPIAEKREEVEQEFECLDRCMQQLTENNRELVLAYYQHDKRAKIEHRKALAESLGFAQNALRIRACRIRAILQKCVMGCLAENAPA